MHTHSSEGQSTPAHKISKGSHTKLASGDFMGLYARDATLKIFTVEQLDSDYESEEE
jgi:hypothetical protein